MAASRWPVRLDGLLLSLAMRLPANRISAGAGRLPRPAWLGSRGLAPM
jgi:hypothetical protein